MRGRRLLEDVMVRRLKEDVREVVGGFPRHKVVQVDIKDLPSDAPELRLSALLDQYRRLREQRLKDETRRKQAAAGLLISGLQQRLLSSIEAFARTLRVHRRTVQRPWQEAQAGKPLKEQNPGKLDLLSGGVGMDDDRATLSGEELQAEEEAQIETATAATAGLMTEPSAQGLFAREQRLLDEMTEIAEASRGLPDARVHRLVDWIRDHMCPGLPALGKLASASPPATWNDTRLILFTEWEHTDGYLREQLSAAIAGTDRADERIAVYHGPTPPAEREEIKWAFNTDPKKHPMRILIATDAAYEGLNLQAHCYNLFHFDLPWNPSRLEQRNGRIDRKLQPRPEVFCHYFVYQRVEDRVLKVLVRKTVTIKDELGSLFQVVEERLAKTLQIGIRHEDIERLKKEIEGADLDSEDKRTVAEELEEARERQDDLRRQIETLRTRLAESKRWIGLEEGHFRSAISCGLELMGAIPLNTLPNTLDWDRPLERFQFPPLDQRAGADPTWADTMDTLRTPRRRDQKPWEWRRNSPIRPVVFEDPGTMDEDVVHLHLEQRVVKRLLSRFTAQGFIHNDLSRACLSQTSDAIPRVLLLGRLCLYGPGVARLHEELVPVTARWIDPSQRRGPLRPYAREAEARTLDLLEEALLLKSGRPIEDPVQRRLQATVSRDVQDLLLHLEERTRQLAEDAKERLAERGQREAQAIRDILENQKRRVAETAQRYDDPQLSLDFSAEERRQLESNRRHWQKRLAEIDRDLAREPARIRDLYTLRATRVEPVGLVDCSLNFATLTVLSKKAEDHGRKPVGECLGGG